MRHRYSESESVFPLRGRVDVETTLGHDTRLAQVTVSESESESVFIVSVSSPVQSSQVKFYSKMAALSIRFKLCFRAKWLEGRQALYSEPRPLHPVHCSAPLPPESVLRLVIVRCIVGGWAVVNGYEACRYPLRHLRGFKGEDFSPGSSEIAFLGPR